ncbi:MAG: glycosyltransferase [Proteobacteria bacterium]|nr:MAG: glycosyltransferase [Pseudomonadota bacterium]
MGQRARDQLHGSAPHVGSARGPVRPADPSGARRRRLVSARHAVNRKTRKAAVILPVRAQRDDWLDRAVESVFDQSVPCELIVVTSTQTPQSNLDTLARRLAGNSHAVIVHRPAGAGFADALNTGFETARADRVGLLLSDDWLRPRAVERCLAMDADIVSTGQTTYLEDGETLLASRWCDANIFDTLPTNLERANYLSHFFLFSRRAVLDVGGVDRSIGTAGADDFDLIWTLLDAGASVAIVEEPLYCYRDHGETRLSLREPAVQIRSLQRILDKHGVYGSWRQRILESHGQWFGAPIASIIGAQDKTLFTLPRTATRTLVRSARYLASEMESATGRLVTEGIECRHGRDLPGHCLYGPGLTPAGDCSIAVRFELTFQDVAPGEEPAVTLDVYDQDLDRIAVIEDHAPRAAGNAEYLLSFNAIAAHRYEFRVYWHGVVNLLVRGIRLKADAAVLEHVGDVSDTRSGAHDVALAPSPRRQWSCRRGGGAQPPPAPLRRRAWFEHAVLLVRKRYPDALIDLERAGVPPNHARAIRFAQLNLYATDIDDLPGGLFFDRTVHWHRQQLAEPGLVGSVGLHYPDRDRVVVSLLQSDLMQRFACIPEYRALRTRLDNRYGGWYKVLFNALLDHARSAGIERVYSPTATTALSRIRRPVDEAFFRRTYDYPPKAYDTRRIRSAERSYWEIDVTANNGRIAELSPHQRTWTMPKTVCLLHDIERNVDTPVSTARCRENLVRMLSVEKALGIRATYNVLGSMFENTEPLIRGYGDHAIGYHSFDHRAGQDGQLPRVREVSWQPLGYRPPRSELTPEIADHNLAAYNFEWLASSAYSFGFDTPRVSGGVVQIPIARDDYDLYTGALDIDQWMQTILDEAGSRDVYAFSVHDCYADKWLPVYTELLDELKKLARFVDCDTLAGEIFRTTSRFTHPFDD